MKQNNRKSINHVFRTATLLPTAVFSVGLMAPAVHATIVLPDEVIVTARRTEEAIQSVPISMTVMSQEMLNERNVTSGADLANGTPSLNVNTRFGSDQASFSIRGFTQEIRTAASVAVYFADVVAPRGGGSITSGDGAGPGSFFDLQNMQILKGPQGTLFGRNTTGGAIMLTPQEPTTELEGYLEQSVGNYNMRRTQGVINVPLTDNARARFGIDHQTRDGYYNNVSGVGPDRLGNVDYTSGRASLIVDLPNDIQNYTIFSMTSSENNGVLQALFACQPGNATCQATLDKQGSDFYAVASGDVTDPVSKLKQWQFINTTSWDENEAFTVKNILSFSNIKQDMVTSIFGSNFQLPTDLGTTFPPFAPLAGAHIATYSIAPSNMHTNAQKGFVEELRFQGLALDSRLNWQTGLYYESSKPDGTAGTLSPLGIACDSNTLAGDPSTWQCYDPAQLQGQPGAVQANIGTIEYRNMAVYGQATYDITDEFRVTGGLRYTDDQTDGESEALLYNNFASPLTPGFTLAPPGGPGTTGCVMTTASMPDCTVKTNQHSEAPTWLIGFDYLPTPDLMVYAKYARGYRQGSVNIFGAEGTQAFEPEKVDAYEVGMKSSFYAPLSGTFNIAVFYNELSDQQIQVGYSGQQVSATTGILNAGSSTIQGVEAETTLQLYDGLVFSLAYTFLDTKLNTLEVPPVRPPYDALQLTSAEGGPLPQSPRNTATAALSYRLPLPAEIGVVSVGGNYSFMDGYLASTVGPYGTIPSHHVVNLNASWKAIAGSGFDAALFATNVTNEEYRTFVPGLMDAIGGEFQTTGEPKMVGARLKYNF